MRRAAQLIARAAGRLSRLLGRGGGTTVPGVVLLRMRPRAVRELASELSWGSIVISATNGKTTTARLVRSVLDGEGRVTVANTAGSNLLRGVATALLDHDRDAEVGLFEVDEAALPAVVDQVEPRVIVLMNLFRDQLDRYGELETLVARWREMIDALDPDVHLVLDADDPAIASLGLDRAGVTWFGFDDATHDRRHTDHAADSTNCPRCDHPLEYSLVTIGHLGHWRCPGCGLERPSPDVSVRHVTLHGLDASEIEVETPVGVVRTRLALPGLHNTYNAAAAIATALAIGTPPDRLGPMLRTTTAAFGRGERVRLDGRDLLLLLAKNPAGANENVRLVASAPAPQHVLLLLNDRTADGQDVSWIWDVDYEPLFETAAPITVAGDRAPDLALRLVYGGFERRNVHVETSVAAAVDHAVESVPPGETLYVLPTYTAMLDLRRDLVDRGVAADFWAEVPAP